MKIATASGIDPPDVPGSLDVDVEDDVLAGRQPREHLGLGGPVDVVVHLVVLEKLVALDHPLEVVDGHEVVLAAVRLPRAHRARRVRDGEVQGRARRTLRGDAG